MNKIPLNEFVVEKHRLIESNSSKLPPKVLCRVEYPICNIGKLNKNHRMYEKKVWEDVIASKEIQEKMEKRCLFGQAEHPESTESNLEKTSHVIIGMRIDESDDKVYQMIDVLDTYYGRLVDTILEAQCSVGVSTRAEGELEEAIDEDGNKYHRVVTEAYDYITTDFTAEPSTVNPYPNKVERTLVTQISTGVGEGKIDKEYASSILEKLECKEAKVLLENFKSKSNSKKKIVEQIDDKKMEDEIRNALKSVIKTGLDNKSDVSSEDAMLDKEEVMLDALSRDTAEICRSDPDKWDAIYTKILKELADKAIKALSERKLKEVANPDYYKPKSKVKIGSLKGAPEKIGFILGKAAASELQDKGFNSEEIKLLSDFLYDNSEVVIHSLEGAPKKVGLNLRAPNENKKKEFAFECFDGMVAFLKKKWSDGTDDEKKKLKEALDSTFSEEESQVVDGPETVKKEEDEDDDEEVDENISLADKQYRDLQVEEASTRAERDKALELVKQSNENVIALSNMHDMELEIASSKTDDVDDTDKNASLEKALERRVKERNEAIAKSDAIVKEHKQKFITLKKTYDKELNKLKEKYNQELVYNYANACIEARSLKLPAKSRALLEKCSSCSEVDSMLNTLIEDLREGALHSTLNNVMIDEQIGSPEALKLRRDISMAFDGMLGSKD